MALILRRSVSADIPFMRQMLYEAVYWKSISNNKNPPFEEGLSEPGVAIALEGWEERAGDTAVIAIMDSSPAGTAWYRFYDSDNAIRGYIDDESPVLATAVHKNYRRLGIGEKLINRLIDEASQQKVDTLSLMVSNDNYAKSLYEKCGFEPYEEIGDSILMTRKISK